MAIHYNTLVPAGTALVSGIASAAVQAASPQVIATPTLSIFVPIVSALIGGAVSYGILKGTVQAVKDSHASMGNDIKSINKNVVDLVGRVSNIEGRIGRRRNDPHLDYDH